MARALRDAGVTHERFTVNAQVSIVLGCLDQLWTYADTHIREDDSLDLGADEIDELVGLKGFCGLMPIDWLEVLNTQAVKLPDFHSHNGTEAKRRALSQKRMVRHRNASASPMRNDTQRMSVTRASPDQTRPDLDQTRGEEVRAAAPPPKAKPAKRCPADFELSALDRAKVMTECPGIDLDHELRKFRDHTFATARADWPATFRNWARKAQEQAKPAGQQATTKFDRAKARIGDTEDFRDF